MNNGNDKLRYGLRVIDIEIQGLRDLRDKLNAAFIEAVDLIHDCAGSVVVTGVGKSGHIGRKIAATMASTGTSAYFVHPAEASHGDLGMLSPDDILLAISNSGETRELSDILLFAKKNKLPVLAITKDANSTLGRIADVVLELPDSREACPLERAPTTSTTATLVLGDALAMTLMKVRGFKDNDFVNLHPGGKLGAALLTVEELIERHGDEELPLVGEDTPMQEVVLTITRGMRGHAGVVDDEGRLVGIISDGDLRRAYGLQEANPDAAAIMSRNPKTVGRSMRAYEVRDLMKRHKISAVFVVDGDNRPIGILHLQELLRL